MNISTIFDMSRLTGATLVGYPREKEMPERAASHAKVGASPDHEPEKLNRAAFSATIHCLTFAIASPLIARRSASRRTS